jgi:hypothetical protein
MSAINTDKKESSPEAWLFRNKEALRSVREGLKQSESGKLQDLGNFAQYLEEDDVTDAHNLQELFLKNGK